MGLRLPPALPRLDARHRPDRLPPPVEIDTVEATGGHITNLDLWVDPEGRAHLLYLKTNLSPVLRDEFFPGRAIVTTLEHVEIVEGKVARRTTLCSGGEKARETPQYARFHVAEDGTPWVVELVSGTRPDGSSLHENRVFAIRPGEGKFAPMSLALKTPFSTFFTATPARGQPAFQPARPLRHRGGRRDAPLCAGALAVASPCVGEWLASK